MKCWLLSGAFPGLDGRYGFVVPHETKCSRAASPSATGRRAAPSPGAPVRGQTIQRRKGKIVTSARILRLTARQLGGRGKALRIRWHSAARRSGLLYSNLGSISGVRFGSLLAGVDEWL
jgi:hypothetical protein